MHEVLIVRVIHCDDEVEIQKIQTGKRTCLMGQSEATLHGGIAHTPVREFSPMAAVCSGRIHLEAVLSPVFTNYMFEYTLRRR